VGRNQQKLLFGTNGFYTARNKVNITGLSHTYVPRFSRNIDSAQSCTQNDQKGQKDLELSSSADMARQTHFIA
jgi:hypothetical protein